MPAKSQTTATKKAPAKKTGSDVRKAHSTPAAVTKALTGAPSSKGYKVGTGPKLLKFLMAERYHLTSLIEQFSDGTTNIKRQQLHEDLAKVDKMINMLDAAWPGIDKDAVQAKVVDTIVARNKANANREGKQVRTDKKKAAPAIDDDGFGI